MRRLEQLGAVRVDIGQRDVSWVVMADPEGNEFCVLRSRPLPYGPPANAAPVADKGGRTVEVEALRRTGDGGSPSQTTLFGDVQRNDCCPTAV